MGGFLHGRMEKVAVFFFLKTMQFQDFDLIVEDPCCVVDKINIQNPLTVHIGGFLGNGWDKGSGGSNRVNTVLVGAPGGDDRIVRTSEKGQVFVFVVPKGTTSNTFVLLDKTTRAGKRRSFQKRTR